MMGLTVSDPDGIEGNIPQLPGLGLLPIHTTMTAEKVTRQVEFDWNGTPCRGYEIHQGVSDTDERILNENNCLGTYIHGLLDNPAVIHSILKDKVHEERKMMSLDEFKEQQYDLLADHVRKYVDIEKLYEILRHD